MAETSKVTNLRRTDEDRARNVPMRLLLGNKEREVRPLVIKHSREWKNLLSKTLTELSGIEFDDVMSKDGKVQSDALARAISDFAVKVPDRLFDLLAAYLEAVANPWLESTPGAFERPADVKAWLEENATDEEITDALWAILHVTFPFLWRVGDLMTVAGALAKK